MSDLDDRAVEEIRRRWDAPDEPEETIKRTTEFALMRLHLAVMDLRDAAGWARFETWARSRPALLVAAPPLLVLILLAWVAYTIATA